ncbi:hypothetical protein LSCM1_04436 [Leishmania martiniquensis]|uniref:Zinc finger C2H2 LYAR-type domain-containing protein n=1 Tax=Leishmania martiniquensis TaxID=1580590 RepID=A0A836GF17_9TRYP|nr:hypothetical protein LSCM1_04436 [Leishmania martiniquensis]
MVSFTCNYCQDVVKKPKVQSHASTCGCEAFTCVDCMHVFDLHTVKGHTSCVTEEEKYQGKWKQRMRDDNKRTKSADALRGGMKRPPRAPMHDLSTSDDSSDDWMTQKVCKDAGAPERPAAATSDRHHKRSTTTCRKHPRSGVGLSSSDDDEMGERTAVVPMVAPAHKKAKNISSAPLTPSSIRPVAASAQVERSPVKEKPVAHAAPVPRQSTKELKSDGERKVAHNGKKDTPLLLPRSTMSRDCIVPSFVLGTSKEVAEIAADVLRDSGLSSMRTKDMAKELVARYAKRIAKSVRHALETAGELGALKIGSDGSVSVG